MKLKILLLIAIFSLAYSAQAQINLGNIRNKIKKPKTNKTKQKDKAAESTNTKKAVSSVSSVSINSDAVMLDETLLGRRDFTFGYTNGRLRLGNIRAMNLPKSIDKTHDKFIITYKSADGRRLAAFRGYAQAPVTKRSWLIGNIIAVDEASKDFVFNKEGNYYLEFSVAGKPFDRFDFSVKRHVNPEGKTTYLINGGWQELAYLKYDPKVRRPFIQFNVFLRDLNEGTGPRPAGTGTYKATIVRAKDKKVIGIDYRKGSTIGLHRYWDSPRLMFQDANKPERLKPETLLSQDGKYYVELIYSGKLFGRYYFNVKNRQFQGLSQYKGEKIGTDGTVTWMLRQK